MVDTPRGRNLRPPPRTVEVVTVERIAPRLVAITFGGDALRGFPEPPPTSHIKIFLPDAEGRLTLPVAGPDGLVWPNGRPPMRTYTPRRYDAAANTLRVDFVLHGDGVAAQWAERCVPGDRAAIGGPGGRFVMDSRVMRWWVGGDESAIPAIATLIEALPTRPRRRCTWRSTARPTTSAFPINRGSTSPGITGPVPTPRGGEVSWSPPRTRERSIRWATTGWDARHRRPAESGLICSPTLA